MEGKPRYRSAPLRAAAIVVVALLICGAFPAAGHAQAAAGVCFCDERGMLPVAQLIRAVNVALRRTDCPPAPPPFAGQCFCDAGGNVSIAQLIRAVNVALELAACPSTRFADTGLTVIDNATGLEWVKSTDDDSLRDQDNEFTWTSSGTAADGTVFTEYLEGLNGANFAGHSDWRLPTSRGADDFDPAHAGELESILDCGFAPCIDPVFGPSSGAAAYWSSSTFQRAPTSAWVGVPETGGVVGDGKRNEFGARAVRNVAPQTPTPRFEDHGLTVVDRQTGLEWVKTDDNGGLTDVDNTYQWSAGDGMSTPDGSVFTEYLAGLNAANYAGHDDWRLPTSGLISGVSPAQPAEIESILDCSFLNPPVNRCIDPVFGPTAQAYWSASTDAGQPHVATLMEFDRVGGGDFKFTTIFVAARAVRGGP